MFQPAMSAVSNWQAEAKDNLDLSSETLALLIRRLYHDA
jgi:hypothetical protein